MKDVEAALGTMLVERAGRVEPARGHRQQTLRRARRRRVVVAAGAALASVALVATGVGAVRALDPSRDAIPAGPETAGKTAATAGQYGFWSTTDEYPFVATGYFRGSKWQLRAAAVRLTDDSPIRLTFQSQERGLTYLTTPPEQVAELDDGLFVSYERAPHGNVARVFGLATPRTHSVEVRIDGRTEPILAHVFEGYDVKTDLEADYFAAFVPADASGRVVARARNGEDLAYALIPRR